MLKSSSTVKKVVGNERIKKKKKARAAAETLDKRRNKWKAGLATEVDRVIGSPRRKV